jgi:hypothetical protein
MALLYSQERVEGRKYSSLKQDVSDVPKQPTRDKFQMI